MAPSAKEGRWVHIETHDYPSTTTKDLMEITMGEDWRTSLKEFIEQGRKGNKEKMLFPHHALLTTPQENGTSTTPNNDNVSGIHLGRADEILKVQEYVLSRRDIEYVVEMLKGSQFLMTRQKNLGEAESGLINNVTKKLRN